ncbi:MAG: hypothetical protein QOJ35_232 [Solirubrobacteraceae bacterium]|nr:hypothetical protein [Solirubrobacteraceae bacterium]
MGGAAPRDPLAHDVGAIKVDAATRERLLVLVTHAPPVVYVGAMRISELSLATP